MSSYPQPNPPAYPQPVYVMRQTSPETEGAASTALWLEIIFGLFSLLGVGHVYSGRVILGIGLMIGWWIYIAASAFFSSVTVGIGACLCVPLFFVVPILSGIQARTYVQSTGGRGSWTSVAFVAGGGCLLLIAAVVITSVILVGMGYVLTPPSLYE